MSEDIDWMLRANAKPRGKRPQYFEDPANDRLLSILMAVAGEVSVLRERLDTVERLLDQKGVLTRADIDGYAPDRAAGLERGAATREYIARIMRGVHQDLEGLKESEPPLEEVSRELRDI
jgi:hypothetical protein